jgi:hypothetical protein
LYGLPHTRAKFEKNPWLFAAPREAFNKEEKRLKNRRERKKQAKKG